MNNFLLGFLDALLQFFSFVFLDGLLEDFVFDFAFFGEVEILFSVIIELLSQGVVMADVLLKLLVTVLTKFYFVL